MRKAIDNIKFSSLKNIINEKLVIISLFLIVFLLRISGIAFNMRIFSAVPDETYYTKVIYNAFYNNSLNLNFYWYPSFFFYFNLILFYIFSFIIKLTLFFVKCTPFLKSLIVNNLFYIIKIFIRSLNAVLGTILVFVVFKISRLVFKKKYLSLLVLLLIGFNSQFIINSHLGKPDILHSLLTQITLYLSLIFYKEKKEKYFYLSIISSALAAGTKILGGVSVLIPISLLFIEKTKKKDIIGFFKKSTQAFFLWIITFLLSTPFIVLEFSKAKHVFKFYENLPKTKHYGYLYFERFHRFFDILKNIFTVPELFLLAISLIIGFMFIIKKRDMNFNIIYFFFTLYFFIGLIKNFFDARYYLPAIPEAFILIVFIVYILLTKIKKRVYRIILWIFVLSLPIYKGTITALSFFLETTQEENYQYITHIPPKTMYAFEMITGTIPMENNVRVVYLGKKFPKFYKNSRITFVIQNPNIFNMFFHYPEARNSLSVLYNNYRWVFNHSVIMKKIRKHPIDFLNPEIDYRKFIDSFSPADSILILQGKLKNKTKHHFLIMSGNRTICKIPPRTSIYINKKHKVNFDMGRSIFIFVPIMHNCKRTKTKRYLQFDLSMKIIKNNINYIHKSKGFVYFNNPKIIYIDGKSEK
jgi:hypothetical protein